MAIEVEVDEPEPTVRDLLQRWLHARRVLRKMSPDVREKRLDMRDWGVLTALGVVGCLACHCSRDMWFVSQGFTSEIVHGQIVFTGLDPREFFGRTGFHDVLLATSLRYDEVVARVDGLIERLRKGNADLIPCASGEAVTPQAA